MTTIRLYQRNNSVARLTDAVIDGRHMISVETGNGAKMYVTGNVTAVVLDLLRGSAAVELVGSSWLAVYDASAGEFSIFKNDVLRLYRNSRQLAEMLVSLIETEQLSEESEENEATPLVRLYTHNAVTRLCNDTIDGQPVLAVRQDNNITMFVAGNTSSVLMDLLDKSCLVSFAGEERLDVFQKDVGAFSDFDGGAFRRYLHIPQLADEIIRFLQF